ALIESAVAGGDPSDRPGLFRREGAVEGRREAVRVGFHQFQSMELLDRREHDIGCEWKRGDDGPRSDRTVVGTVGCAARYVVVEASHDTIDAACDTARAIACRETPA